jgi:hypothetical protein
MSARLRRSIENRAGGRCESCLITFGRKDRNISTETLIEQRLTAVEATVAALQRRLVPPQPASNWLEQMIGSFKDEPAFEEVLAYGRMLREADRPTGDDGA